MNKLLIFAAEDCSSHIVVVYKLCQSSKNACLWKCYSKMLYRVQFAFVTIVVYFQNCNPNFFPSNIISAL